MTETRETRRSEAIERLVALTERPEWLGEGEFCANEQALADINVVLADLAACRGQLTAKDAEIARLTVVDPCDRCGHDRDAHKPLTSLPEHAGTSPFCRTWCDCQSFRAALLTPSPVPGKSE